MKPKIRPDVRARWLRVIRMIQTQPRAYDQESFGGSRLALFSRTRPTCKSPACLVGWFYAFTPSDERLTLSMDEVAGAAMGHDASWSMNHLSAASGFGWPKALRARLHNADTEKARAAVAVARIRHLLRTGK